MTHEKFYLVWCERGAIPTVKHRTHDLACREAERLAKINSGDTFHVLECVSSCTYTNVIWTGELPLPF